MADGQLSFEPEHWKREAAFKKSSVFKSPTERKGARKWFFLAKSLLLNHNEQKTTAALS